MADPVAEVFQLSSLFNSPLTPIQIIITLVTALLLGSFIFLIYKKTFGGVLYSRTFNLSLILLTMVTSLVIILITQNATLSLGMVGALSIIRFRTAVKDPMDTAFMFWSVSEGIALGAQFFDVALLGAAIIGIVLAVISLTKTRGAMPYLLILHYHEAAGNSVKGLVKQLPRTKVRSRTAQRDGLELTLEIRLHNEETAIVDKFLHIEGVYDATLIAHQGDIVS